MAAPSAAPHPDELAFLATIIANPDDNCARLVYADWLDEQSQPLRARYIRQKILGGPALGLTGSIEDQLMALADLEEDSILAFCDWAGDLAPYFRDKHNYDRGLLSAVLVMDSNIFYLLSSDNRLFQLAPVQRLTIGGGNPDEICTLLHRPELARMRELKMRWWCWSNALDLIADALMTSPYLADLKKLQVYSPEPEYVDEDSPRRDPYSIERWARLRERFGPRLTVTLSDW